MVQKKKMVKSIGNRGYGLTKNSLTNDELDFIRDALTVKANNFGYDNVNVNEDTSFKIYVESEKKIYVPKFWGINEYGVADDYKLNKCIQMNKDIEFKGTLRDYQEEPINCYENIVSTMVKAYGVGGGILQVPPGWGKTVMAIYLMSKLKLKTLVIVHKDFLIQQWRERLQTYMSNVDIGLIKGKNVDIDGKDVVIGTLQSISMKNYDQNIFNDFGFVVIDECHHLGAQVFSQALRKVNFTYSLGLSATVTRKDGLTKVFKWYLGDIVYKAKNDKKSSSTQVIIKHFNEIHNEYSREILLYNNKPNVSRMLNNICYFYKRNLIIVDEISKLYHDTKREILVLSDRREQLSMLYELLKKKRIEDVGYYMGGMKNVELCESEKKRIILGTYNMISEGFDLPKLNTLVMASPKSDIEQTVGRIHRQLEHERLYQPLVVDINDNFSIFKNQSKKRLSYYTKKGFTINEIDKCQHLELKFDKCLL